MVEAQQLGEAKVRLRSLLRMHSEATVVTKHKKRTDPICSVKNLQEIAAPNEMCLANLELGKRQSASVCG